MKVFAIRTNARYRTWRILVRSIGEDTHYLLKNLSVVHRHNIDADNRDVFNSSREAIGALKKAFPNCKRVNSEKVHYYWDFIFLSSDIFFIQE